jgi:L-cysteine S-thiosulfotransferase
MKTSFLRAAALAAAAAGAAVLLSACSSLPSSAELDAMAKQMMQSSFRDQGIATVSRLQQDLALEACSSDKPPPDNVAQRIMEEARATVKLPAGRQFFGDFREGERLAQSGRGLTWTDASAATSANGGNCYNCHQLSAAEVSHGTIGPSLLNYGRNRGIADLNAPTAQPIIEYVWAKLYNARSYSACSSMPRFGHAGILDETQLRHLMSLLLDPQSPVNR